MLSIGTLKSFNSTDYRAEVQLAGSIAAYLDNIPVARNIASDQMIAGRHVIVAIPGDNPKDACVIAVWDAAAGGGGGGGGGASNFLALTDTPASYAGQAGKYPKVNAAADALEFGLALDAHKARHEIYGDDVLNFFALLFNGRKFLFESWKSRDGWTDYTDGTGSITSSVLMLKLLTGVNINSHSGVRTDYVLGGPHQAGVRAQIYAFAWGTPADTEFRFYLLRNTGAVPPVDTNEHGGFKIINGVVYASNADGVTEKVTNTGVTIPTWGGATFEIRGVGGNTIKFYVNGVLKATHTENLPANNNYCLILILKNTVAAGRTWGIEQLIHLMVT